MANGPRTCHCVGYLNNPGGVCCKDLYRPTITTGNTWVTSTSPVPAQLTEEDIRRIIREELDRG